MAVSPNKEHLESSCFGDIHPTPNDVPKGFPIKIRAHVSTPLAKKVGKETRSTSQATRRATNMSNLCLETKSLFPGDVHVYIHIYMYLVIYLLYIPCILPMRTLLLCQMPGVVKL